MEGKINSKQIMIVWWYKEVSAELFEYLKHLYAYIFDMFSVKICFSTLFAPWKRDSINTEGLAIKERFQVLLLNLTSRLVGAIIKLGTVFTFLIFAVLTTLASTVVVLAWFIYPAIPILLIIYGIKIISL